MWLVWLALAVIFLVLEVNVGTFYLLVLAVSGLLALVAAVLDFSLLLQGSVFVVAAFLMYVFLMPLLKKLIPPSQETVPTATSDLVGQLGIVVRDIVPGMGGQVKVGPDIWTAEANELIEKGTFVTVLAVHINKLLVQKGS